MRSTFRLLASIKPARYLEPGVATGLTGVYTHNSPRATLLFLYGSTLEKINALPESSLYRQSVEAVTKHRMALVEATVPPGYPEWSAKIQSILAENPKLETDLARAHGTEGHTVKVGGRTFVVAKRNEPGDVRTEEWDGQESQDLYVEGSSIKGEDLTPESLKLLEDVDKAHRDSPKVELGPEPQLTADQ